ncbi:Universal stress protein family protein [uncultured archaeon]|nr:Universal stress protein family protein [uncultured archaeon]
MFKRVLVLVKATKGSERAIEVACDLASQLDGTVHLIAVDFEGDEDKPRPEMLEKAANTCRSKGINATYSMHRARSKEDVAVTIASISADYDIIVMGHCRYKKIYKFLHYSLAEDLITLVACPVVVAAIDCPEKQVI